MAKKRAAPSAAKEPARRAPKRAKPKRATTKPSAPPAPPAAQAPPPSPYDQARRAAALASRARSATGRDIGAIPPVDDPGAKERARTDLEFFALRCFPESFYLGFSADHRRVIRTLQRAVVEGGKFAVAMPRGSGKTTLAIVAVIWALFYGHRRFVALIGASKAKAVELLESIKTELETNEQLLGMFPEVCYAIRKLERIYNRCKGQTHGGVPTRVEVTADALVLPHVEGSAASAGIVRVAGITGGFRGMQYTRPGGERARPDLCIIDDPQTDKSAASATQCEQRERILAGAVLGLAGPGKTIAAVMPCTVIRRGDLADRLLDRSLHPEWQGERTRLLLSLPTDAKLWDEYAEVLKEGLRAADEGKAANRFYRKRRKAMDAGAEAAWKERKLPHEVSAIQHAMNLKIANEHAFFAEYQNDPLETDTRPAGLLTADQICERVNGVPRGELPLEATHVTAFIDVQDKLLYWAVCAFGDGFTGQVVDYGAWPDPGLRFYTLSQVTRTLADVAPAGAGFEAKIYHGLAELTGHLFGRRFTRADGAELEVSLAMIDANWGRSTEVVRQFVREHPYGGRLWPSHGRYYGASRAPLNAGPRKVGERRGPCWKIPRLERGGTSRHVLWDTNYWKSFLHARLATPRGDRGALGLFGSRAAEHRMLATHLTAEAPIEVTANDRTVAEWREVQVGQDNHLLDCVVGCCVGASVEGVHLLDRAPGAKPPERAPLKLSELQAARRRRR